MTESKKTRNPYVATMWVPITAVGVTTMAFTAGLSNGLLDACLRAAIIGVLFGMPMTISWLVWVWWKLRTDKKP